MSEDERLKSTIAHWVKSGLYEAIVYELLAYAHRDNGQYTSLVGLEVSIFDALKIVDSLHKDNAALKARLNKLTGSPL